MNNKIIFSQQLLKKIALKQKSKRLTKINNKGFYFSLEAIIVFTLFLGMLFFIPELQEINLTELYVLQKQHDLFKVWNFSEELNSKELISDTKLMFPFNEFELVLDGQVLRSGNSLSEKRLSSINYMYSKKWHVIKLTVFY